MHHKRVVPGTVVARIKADPAAARVQAAIEKLHTAQWFECCNDGGKFRIDLTALELDALVRERAVRQLSDSPFLKKEVREKSIEPTKSAVTLRTRRPMNANDMRKVCENCIRAVLVVEQVRVESALWPIYKLH